MPTEPSKRPDESRQRRVYLSYSSRGDRQTLNDVLTALRQAGYEPNDHSAVRKTGDLRQVIQSVDAAVVLVGRSTLESNVVASEVVELLARRTDELLGERRTREPFPVVPLLEETVSAAEVRASLPALAELPLPTAESFADRLTETVTMLDATLAGSRTAPRPEDPVRLSTVRVIDARTPVESVALGEVAGRPVLVAGGMDGTVRMWDLGRPSDVATVLRGHSGPVLSVAVGTLVGADVIVSGGEDKTVRVWDTATGKTREISHLDAIVTGVDVGHIGENEFVVSSDGDGVTAFGAPPLNVMSVEPHAVNDIALNRDGTLFTAGSDGTVRAWWAVGDETVFVGHKGAVGGVATGGGAVFSGGHDGTVRRWDVETGQETHRLDTGTAVWRIAAGVVDGVTTVVSGGEGDLVHLWDPHNGTGTTLAGHTGPIRGVAVGTLGDKPIVVSGSRDGTIRIWGTAVADQVDWLSDAPSDRDLLHRRPLARTIAARLRRMSDEEPGTSFLVHIDGPWGTGKSTLLNFLDGELRDGFVTVRFDAWREAGVGPAWWALLTALRASVRQQRGRLARSWLLVTESAARLRRVGAPFLLAFLGLVVLAGGLFWLFTPVNLSGLKDAAGTVVGALTAVGAVWAGALVASRFLLWDSARGARLFEQSNTNPMLEVTRHFGWLLRESSKPVVFLVDDLDRCPDAYVVELLDSVQTLVRDSGRPSAHVVVAADGAWIRTSYELHYETFADVVAAPGQPLGYLFLDKFFQLRIPVPAIDATRQRQYLRELLRGPIGPPQPATLAQEEGRVRAQLDRSTTEAQVVETLRATSDEVRDRVASAALEKLTTPEAVAATEHSLQRFAVLLPPNPRTMKRFVNTYSAMRAVRTLEGNAVRVESLALWTIIEIRWPGLADHLRVRPESITLVGTDDLAEVPESLRPVFADPALRLLVGFDLTAPLDAGLIRACCGAGNYSDQA